MSLAILSSTLEQERALESLPPRTVGTVDTRAQLSQAAAGSKEAGQLP